MERDQTLATLILFVMAIICSFTVIADTEIFRCEMADGRIVINDKGCGDGIILKHYDNKQMDKFSQQNGMRPPAGKRVTIQKKTSSNNRKRHHSSGYASRATLAKVCGKKFDGINATYLKELKRGLKIRESERRVKKAPPSEIKELRCRIKRLELAGR